jgi:hypothetical protein
MMTKSKTRADAGLSLGDSAFEKMGNTVQNSLSNLSYGQFSPHVQLVKKPAITGSFELQQRGRTGTGAFETRYMASAEAAGHVTPVSGDTLSSAFHAPVPDVYDGGPPKASHQTTTNAVRDQQPDYLELDGVDPHADPQINIRARRGG